MKYAEDIAALSGIALIGWGVYQIRPEAAAVAVGSILLVIGLSAGIAKAIRG